MEAEQTHMQGRRVLLGICGSIAAYKAPLLVRELIKAGAEVRVCMTPGATRFVPALTLHNLTKHPIAVEMFDEGVQQGGSWHIHLAHWCDLMLIAPCSATTLSKLATGNADTTVSALALALPPDKPLLIAPAMDTDMWQHPATQRNVRIVQEDGADIIPPASGELASGLSGPGRLPETESLLKELYEALRRALENLVQRFEPDPEQELIRSALAKPSFGLQDAVESDEFDAALELERLKNSGKAAARATSLKGKTVLVTAGPTREKLDDVRFLANHSSGKMGFAVAAEAAARGAEVVLVAGPVHLPTPEGVQRVDVESAREMYDTVMQHRARVHYAIFAAAVADFRPKEAHSGKMKKADFGAEMQLALERTPDILAAFGAVKTPGQILVGFALEAADEEANARRKLSDKGCDYLVLNSLHGERSGFGGEDNTITVFSADGRSRSFPPMSKAACARAIWDEVLPSQASATQSAS